MKSNMYLNCVLTVIAIALTILVLQNADLMPKVQAHNDMLSPNNEITDVRVVEWKVYDNIGVNVKRWEVNDAINMNLEEVAGWYISNGVLKVETQ